MNRTTMKMKSTRQMSSLTKSFPLAAVIAAQG